MNNTQNNGAVNHNGHKKKKRVVSARFLWFISVIAAVIFLIVFWSTPVFPFKWVLIVMAVLAVILGLTFLLSVKTSPRNLFTKIVNVVLAVVLLIGSILIPYEIDKVSNIFNNVSGTTVTINVYRMSDEYISANSFTKVYSYDANDDGTVKDISSLSDAVFITSVNTDSGNSDYALSQLNSAFGSSVKSTDVSSYLDAAQSLYAHDGDFMIMPASYESVLTDSTAYANFASDTQIVYSFKRTVDSSSTVKGDTTLTSKPFTIFFGGNDQTGELSLEGRTDVCMVVTVNPNTHTIAIINMPRDSYIPNPYYNDKKDKLTHLGLVGIDNTLTGLGNYLDETINNYVLLNFDTFQNIITALDGVDIYNPYSFTALDDEYFPEGNIHLTAVSALMYVRERYSLPDGDFGRNEHQQIVMSAIIDKITSAEGILKFNDILTSLSGQFLTNVSTDAIYGLVNKQLSDGMSWNIVKYHVLGETGSEVCASAPGQELSIVYPYTNQVNFVKSVMDSVDAGDYVEQEELPEGSYSDS